MEEALDLIPFWSTVDRESPEQIKRICTYVVDGRTLARQVWESEAQTSTTALVAISFIMAD